MAPHDGPQREVKTILDVVSEARGRHLQIFSVHKKTGSVWTADGFFSLRVLGSAAAAMEPNELQKHHTTRSFLFCTSASALLCVSVTDQPSCLVVHTLLSTWSVQSGTERPRSLLDKLCHGNSF